MRRREISPQFFSNPEVIRCSPLARLLFAGLWCVADREGRLEDKPNHLKLGLFPDQRVDVAKLLAELADEGLIQRYVADGKKFLWIPGFLRWQHVHPKEAPSTLPECSRVITRQAAELQDQPLVNRAGSSFPSGPSGSSWSPNGDSATAQVFAAWLLATGRTGGRTKLTERRRQHITARLRDGYPLEDLLDAVEGWRNDPWPDRPLHNDIDVLLRNGEQLEKFRDLHRHGRPLTGRIAAQASALENWAASVPDETTPRLEAAQ